MQLRRKGREAINVKSRPIYRKKCGVPFVVYRTFSIFVIIQDKERDKHFKIMDYHYKEDVNNHTNWELFFEVMDRIILFFLGSVLLLSGCKNSKQPEGYNSVNIIEYVDVYDENNRILTAQGSEYDYLYFGDNKDKGILAATNNFTKTYSYDNDSYCYTVEEPLSGWKI